MTLNIKQDFPILQNNPELAYLDNAATSQKPRQVIQAIKNYYETQNANVGRSNHELGRKATVQYQEARKTCADYLGCKPSETIFVKNTTEGINTAAQSLPIDGDIVLTEMAHHSNMLPWRQRAQKQGLNVEYIPTENNQLDLEQAEKIIDKDTGLISVSHISNVFGCKNNIEKLGELAEQNNALLFVDAAQSAPRTQYQLENTNIDALTFSGHKTLGPMGSGILYIRRKLLEKTTPHRTGGGMVGKVTYEDYTTENGPEKLEPGTPNVAAAKGLQKALQYLENIGMQKIQEHEQKIKDQILEQLKRLDYVKTYTPQDEHVSATSFTIDNVHPHDASQILSQHNIAVRAGQHCAQPQLQQTNQQGTIRASPYIYNNTEDTKKLTEAIKQTHNKLT